MLLVIKDMLLIILHLQYSKLQYNKLIPSQIQHTKMGMKMNQKWTLHMIRDYIFLLVLTMIICYYKQ